MWILLRLLVGIGLFAMRHFARNPASIGNRGGAAAYEQIHQTKSRVNGFRIGLALDSPTAFAFHRENAWDRLLKDLGLAGEIETGDTAFDGAVYVVCDHPGAGTWLEGSAIARDAVVHVLAGDCKAIRCDKGILWLDHAGSQRSPSAEDWDRLIRLRAAFAGIAPALAEPHRDPFLVKAAAVEVVVYSIVAYGAGAFLAGMIQKEDVHVDPDALILPGVLCAVGLFVGLMAAVAGSMYGSSRGRRVLAESGILLAFAIAPAGFQLVSDLNRGLDTSPATLVEERILGKEIGGSSKHRTYRLWVPAPGVPGRRSVQVSRGLYDAAAEGATFRTTRGAGALGFPWYRSVEVAGG